MKIPELVFFYADDCPRCGPTLDKLAETAPDLAWPITVRKPSLAEAGTPGFAYPALFVPAVLTRAKTPLLLVGENIPSVLMSVLKPVA